jgi:hypothetical protein
MCVPLTGTLTATEDCELLVLSQDSFLKMQRDDPYLALVFARICMVRLAVYLSLSVLAWHLVHIVGTARRWLRRAGNNVESLRVSVHCGASCVSCGVFSQSVRGGTCCTVWYPLALCWLTCMLLW